ncbi:MAG: aldolase/citrate lyase family protein [Armatimonadota bacterium]|nr:aldolase/citrate lyase family protein [Armatimonadota bacterium]
MVKNRALEKLRAGQPTFGLSMVMDDPIVAEYLANSGVDWIWIDEQHGSFHRQSMMQSIQVIGPTGVTPIVRVGMNEFFRIGRALDRGALGLIVPMVSSGEEAEAVVYAAKYPPRGGRSSGGARLAFLGDDYREAANDNTLVAVMIETRRAMGNVDEIAQVDGVDCIFIGPSDLSLSLGCERGSEEHEEALAHILERATAAGKPAGMPCGSPEDAMRRAEQGFTLIHAGSELGMIRTGIEHAQKTLGLAR